MRGFAFLECVRRTFLVFHLQSLGKTVKPEYINPFVLSTLDVFSTMLGCKLTRGELSLNNNFHPAYDISGIIGLTGRASGTVVVSLERAVSLAAVRAILGEMPDSINADVIDTVGELTNMIAGKAKADLAQLEMSLAIPTVVTGKNHVISYGSSAQTISIPYTCEWGSLSVEVGIVDKG